ncbi:hypothetical protein [Moritella viscosa]|uniref:Uncharacterized protein n=1 Tax=Moritella viscosa TaxID=80854 RepID=A0A1K9Z286_9GAMM|nr:hypothetical protein [Moritella viscosa]SGY87528.1 Putative uncharacterized protein [Moritella viscosa]
MSDTPYDSPLHEAPLDHFQPDDFMYVPKEITQLKALWQERTQRSTSLIVPSMSNEHSKLVPDDIHHSHWCFNIPYAFRDALDIKYEQRKKDKKTYMVWTQGPMLSFNEGDTFTSKNQNCALQIIFATGMGWDAAKNEMYQGSVVFEEFKIENKKYTNIKQHSCNQMAFLEILITGSIL